MIEAGENLLLLLSFLEERFIKYIGTTVYYIPNEDQRPLREYLHTHHSKPMEKPYRPDLEARQPMDKFSHSDLKQMYLSYKRINDDFKINFTPIIYLYINGLHANMIYFHIVDLYSCIDKIIDIYPKMKSDFHYVETQNEKGHRLRVRQLCEALEIEYNDLKNNCDPFRYIPIRHAYIHYKKESKYTPEKIWNAAKMAGYLARRLIFSMLGLDYKNFNSCDPLKRGRIGV